ncbi:hypothetical protein HanIR_Chr03g0107221 [Helianthus annuus]|nr:hypothetical protein HanIR_Chr03g0107221 [Helianthus annuus]
MGHYTTKPVLNKRPNADWIATCRFMPKDETFVSLTTTHDLRVISVVRKLDKE